jgi:hypothetical protein
MRLGARECDVAQAHDPLDPLPCEITQHGIERNEIAVDV